MTRKLAILCLLIACGAPSVAPYPDRLVTEPLASAGLEWLNSSPVAAIFPTDTLPRLIAVSAPRDGAGLMDRRLRHSQEWLAAAVTRWGLQGVCNWDIPRCFPHGGQLLTIGQPDLIGPDTATMTVAVEGIAPEFRCASAPGAGGAYAYTPPMRAGGAVWFLALARDATGAWRVAGSPTVMWLDAFNLPCDRAG